MNEQVSEALARLCAAIHVHDVAHEIVRAERRATGHFKAGTLRYKTAKRDRDDARLEIFTLARFLSDLTKA